MKLTNLINVNLIALLIEVQLFAYIILHFKLNTFSSPLPRSRNAKQNDNIIFWFILNHVYTLLRLLRIDADSV